MSCTWPSSCAVRGCHDGCREAVRSQQCILHCQTQSGSSTCGQPTTNCWNWQVRSLHPRNCDEGNLLWDYYSMYRARALLQQKAPDFKQGDALQDAWAFIVSLLCCVTGPRWNEACCLILCIYHSSVHELEMFMFPIIAWPHWDKEFPSGWVRVSKCCLTYFEFPRYLHALG